MKNYLFPFLLLSGCGGSSGGTPNFDSVAGRWEISAQDVTDVECPYLVGGFADSIDVQVEGNTVIATGPLGCEAGSEIQFLGNLTDDGFIIEGTPPPPCTGTNLVTYRITVTGLESNADDQGVGEYLFRQVAEDGSLLCIFRAIGSAHHTSG